MFAFYPPLPYYPVELLHLLGLSFFASIKLSFLLAFLLSGLFMYSLVRDLFGRLAGLVAAVFYVYAPYHSVDVYVRGALNEAWGMVWFPLILLYAKRIIAPSNPTATTRKRNLIFLALSYAALLLSHNVMTLIFTPILALWSLYWIATTRHWLRLKPLLIAGLWGVGLAAFFFLPVVLEKRFVHVETRLVVVPSRAATPATPRPSSSIRFVASVEKAR